MSIEKSKDAGIALMLQDGEWTLVLPGAGSVISFKYTLVKQAMVPRFMFDQHDQVNQYPLAAFEVYYWDVNIPQPVIQLLDSTPTFLFSLFK